MVFEEYSVKWLEGELLRSKSNYYEIKNCPACDGDAAQHFDADKFHYLICHHCGTVFEEQRPTDIGVELIYNSIFSDYWRSKIEIPAFLGHSHEKYSMRKKYLDILAKQLLSSISEEHRTLLDFASGLGVIADYYHKTGRFGEVYCYEINTLASEFIRKNFPQLKFYDHDVQVDVVILYAALEHFSEPYKLLKEISERLKAGGVIQVYIPYMGILTRTFFPNMYEMLSSGMHLNFFSKKGLKALAQRVNLELEDVKYMQTPKRYLWSILYSKKGYQTYRLVYDSNSCLDKVVSGYLINDAFYDSTNIGNWVIRNTSKALDRLKLNAPLKLIDKGYCMSAIMRKPRYTERI